MAAFTSGKVAKIAKDFHDFTDNQIEALTERLNRNNGPWCARIYLTRELNFPKWKDLLVALGCEKSKFLDDPNSTGKLKSVSRSIKNRNRNRSKKQINFPH